MAALKQVDQSEAIKLYENDHLVVIYRAGDSSLVVTFNEVGMKAGGLDFWGAAFLQSERHSAIGIVSKIPHWFPVSYMAGAVANINELIQTRGYTNVTTYGFSQGAYGALKYSRALGANKSIALSPQASIVPQDVGRFDKNFLAYHLPGPHDGMLINEDDLCPTNYVFYDPFYKPDCEHLRLISAAGPTTSIPVPFVGHYSANYCAETRSLSSIFRILHSGAPDARNQAVQKLKNSRRTSWRYWAGRANVSSERLSERWSSEKYEACNTALKIRPTNTSVKVTFGELLEKDGRTAEALDLLSSVKVQVAAASQSDILRGWQALRRLGARDAALELVRAASDFQPRNPFLRLRVAMSFRENFRPKEAMIELEFAEAGARDNDPVWVQIAAHWEAPGQPDRAATTLLQAPKT